MLAEVSVQFSEDAAKLYVDAREVVEQLQAGASRIEGPCKAHVMRGRFRQYFLRVEHDGRLVAEQQRLEVAKDKTLQIYIEAVQQFFLLLYFDTDRPL
jgi:hypothetical protein